MKLYGLDLQSLEKIKVHIYNTTREQYANILRAETRRFTIVMRPLTVKVLLADQAEAVALIHRPASEGGEQLGWLFLHFV